MGNNFTKRLLSGFIGLSMFTIVLYYANCAYCWPLIVVFVAAIIALSVNEFYNLLKSKGIKPLKKIGIMAAVAYIGALVWSIKDPAFYFVPWVVLLLALLSSFLYFFFKPNQSLLRLPATFFAFSYLVLPLGCTLAILYYFPEKTGFNGRWWLFYVVVLSKMTDMGAYAVGKVIGRRPLASSISPNKTIEGAIGGVLCAFMGSVAVPLLVSFFSASHTLPFLSFEACFLTLMITALSQIGDLSESLLKRDAGIKDSSDIPGLGGVLDIVDSLIFTIPFMYFYLLAVYPKEMG